MFCYFVEENILWKQNILLTGHKKKDLKQNKHKKLYETWKTIPKTLKGITYFEVSSKLLLFFKVYKNQKQKRVHLTHHVTLKCATCSTYFLEESYGKEKKYLKLFCVVLKDSRHNGVLMMWSIGLYIGCLMEFLLKVFLKNVGKIK